MRIDILSLFPQIAAGALGESIMRRAQEHGLVEIHSHDLRNWTRDKHRITDDTPYGGSPGMVLKCEPIFAAVEELKTKPAQGFATSACREPSAEIKPGEAQDEEPPNHSSEVRESRNAEITRSRVVLMSPGGERFTHQLARELSACPHLIVLCGHYEGVDQRVVDHLVDQEISIGDYVLTNGVIAAVVVVDAVVRLLPGVLGDAQSAEHDSFADGLLEFPHYTRPVEFRGWRVPDILLSGNHAAIAEWRRQQALEKTRRVRPDLLPDVK